MATNKINISRKNVVKVWKELKKNVKKSRQKEITFAITQGRKGGSEENSKRHHSFFWALQKQQLVQLMCQSFSTLEGLREECRAPETEEEETAGRNFVYLGKRPQNATVKLEDFISVWGPCLLAHNFHVNCPINIATIWQRRAYYAWNV